MKFLIPILPLVAPILGYLAGWRWGGRRWWVAVLAAGLGGAALMAWIGAAVSALATAVDPAMAALRGAGIGLAGGVAVGGVVDVGRRLVTRGTPDGREA